MLHKAIKRVGRFAPRVKAAPDLFKAVRWMPAAEIPYLGQDTGSWVLAFDGVVGVAVHVEDALPSVLLPYDGLAQAVTARITAVADQGMSVAIESENGGTFQIPKLEPQGFPYPPQAQGYVAWDIWPNVQRVIHAVGSPKQGQATFAHVCLRPTGVEVTDGVAVAYAPGWAWDTQVLLPGRMLEALRLEGTAELAVGEHYAVLRLPEETRWGLVRRDLAFHDCRGALESVRGRGGTVRVTTKALVEATRQAVSISVSSAVGLIFDGPAVGLLGWRGAAEAAEHVYDVTLPIVGGQPSAAPVTVYLDGKVLGRALRAVDTPVLELGYSVEHEPVRLVWGEVEEMIWPWRL